MTKRVNEKETYHAREYMLSPKVLRTYFKYDPINFFKQAVGFVRDGLLIGTRATELLKIAGGKKRLDVVPVCPSTGKILASNGT